MKIVLLEPLGIADDKLSSLSGQIEAQGHEFTAYSQLSTDTEELKRRSRDADVLIIANHLLPGEVIRSDAALKMISVAFVGIDHVDVEACKEKNVAIYNTGGYCNDAVAELAIGLTIDCLRNISRGNAAVQAREGKAGLKGHELAGRTVGIIGTGAIGCRTAEIFKCFGCRLIGFSRSRRQDAVDLGIEYMPLAEVMGQADIISVHTPLTPETRGLIGAEEIGLMKQGAILINTSRGPVVNTAALADALKSGKICAGTDVFESDPPLPEGHPLLGVPNLICTPHVGFDTFESIDRRAEMVFENIELWQQGLTTRKML